MTSEEKQKAIDALKISAPAIAVKHEEFNDYIQTLNKVMDWLEQEPTTKNDLGVDCISRQAVLELIADYDLSMGQVVKGIHALPSVTPIRPKGHWIDCDNSDDYSADGYDCSVCGVNAEYATSYCPNCGCRMVELQESEG